MPHLTEFMNQKVLPMSHCSCCTLRIPLRFHLCFCVPQMTVSPPHICSWETEADGQTRPKTWLHVQSVQAERHLQRSNHSHKTVVIPAPHQIFFFFFLPLMCLPPPLSRMGEVFITGASRHEIGARFDRLFPWEYQIEGEWNKPQRSRNLLNSHLQPRHSTLPAPLCNVKWWLLFTLITVSRCAFTQSIPASSQGSPLTTRSTTPHLLATQAM